MAHDPSLGTGFVPVGTVSEFVDRLLQMQWRVWSTTACQLVHHGTALAGLTAETDLFSCHINLDGWAFEPCGLLNIDCHSGMSLEAEEWRYSSRITFGVNSGPGGTPTPSLNLPTLYSQYVMSGEWRVK